jgi:polar amino acid transport system substrate-binding protein
MTKPARAAALLGAGVLAALSLTACGEPLDEKEPADTSTVEADDCTPDKLETVADGTLTIGTDKPAYPPWFVDDDPSNGEGYESAVAYAIAEELGYDEDQVTWSVVGFNQAIAPGPKEFDFDLNQVSISEKRAQAIDFSSGYYDVRQTVVTYKGSPIDGVTSVAELKDAKLGAQVGTTSYDAITEQIQPSPQPGVYDTNDLAVQALKNKQIDGIVVDLPTAFYMTAAQLDDGIIAGQLPATDGEVEQFGAVLDKGSSLTPCVSKAVDALREDGTLDQLAGEWLATQGAPELS